MIRPAVDRDIPCLVEMGLRFLSETEYGTLLQANPEAIANLMSRLIDHDDGAVFVLSDDASLIGMIGMHVFTHPFSNERIASELFWWVNPEARRRGMLLFSRAEQWARVQHAVRIQMIAPNDRVATVYRAHGYAKIEESFQKDLR